MRAVITLLLLALTACSTVRSNVESYSSLGHYNGRQLAILPGRDGIDESLEFQSFERMLIEKLTAAGFHVVGIGDRPPYVAFLNYGIDDGQQVARSYSIPQYGVTGYSGGYTTGTFSNLGGMGTFNAQTTLTPTYGITGFQTGAYSETQYSRFLQVDIVEVDWRSGGDYQVVYESNLRSSGSCGRLGAIMPVMLDALFQDFPGQPTRSETVEIPFGGDC